MKESYIQQVKRHLTLTRKQKQEVVRDLEEIFASALEHGESEDQVIARLGTPEEYARSVEGPLEKRRGGTALVGLVVSCVVCVGAVALFLSLKPCGCRKTPSGMPRGAPPSRSQAAWTSPSFYWSLGQRDW